MRRLDEIYCNEKITTFDATLRGCVRMFSMNVALIN